MSSPSTSTKQATVPPPVSPQILTRPPGARPILPAPLPHQRNMGRTTYKPPAHKHAHRLHSIPPREKSTRTLILDHLLWEHARTRMQQARAELGMKVTNEFKTMMVANNEGIAGSAEERVQDPEEDQQSDGEDILAVKFGAKTDDRRQRPAEQDDYDASQDLPLAGLLRLRADGIEKVLIGMLDQPPEHQPHYADDEAPPTPPAIHGVGEHAFPNGLRFRLALSTLVNDLFARDQPTTLAPTTANTPSILARASTSSQGKSPGGIGSISLPPPSIDMKPSTYDSFLADGLPKSLSSLAPISNFGRLMEREVTRSYRSEQSKSKSDPDRISEMYDAGADPTTVNIPPSLRCPRHLHQACAVCSPVKPSPQPGSSANGYGGTGTSPKSPANAPTAKRGAIVFGSNGTKTQVPGSMNGSMGAGLAPWKYGAGIGAGLAQPPIEGTVLRRRTIAFHALAEPNAKNAGLCSSSGKLADLIPRFIRLSALVAVELGREAKEKEDAAARGSGARKEVEVIEVDSDDEDDGDDMDVEQEREAEKQSPRIGSSILKSTTHASPQLVSQAFRPTREWYAILSGLLTRATLEGYFCRAWKGKRGMECLMGVGAGLSLDQPVVVSTSTSSSLKNGLKNSNVHDEDEFAHLDPDECPTLMEAAKVLFPFHTRYPGLSLGVGSARRAPGIEDELAYVAEMAYRSKEFQTPTEDDFSTLLEDLADQYLAEPVERAAVRFCEAVAAWRGQPELESYRKKPQPSSLSSQFIPGPSGPIDSLIQSATGTLHTLASIAGASKPKAPIEMYFVPPPPQPVVMPGKRPRTGSMASVRGASGPLKRTHFEKEKVEEKEPRHADAGDHWTGPYGV